MKKSKLLFLFVLFTVLTFSFTMISQAETASDFTYSIKDGKAVITGYVGSGGKITVPSEIDGYAVSAIGEKAFEYEVFTEITISDGINRIEERAFCDTKATKIILPDSVTYIGDYAFSSCVYLQEIRLSAKLEYIGTRAFENTSILKKISLPDSLAEMGEGVFYGSGIKTINIPSKLTKIPAATFVFSELTEIIIPATVKEIGIGAFEACLYLKKVTFLGDIEKIADHTFHSCNRLQSINFPDSVTEIGESAFKCCFKLTLSKLPSKLKTIGNNAFDDCVAITEIFIPDGVKKIGYRAFSSCKALEKIDLNNVVEIGEETFVGCKNLKQVVFGTSVKTMGKKAFSLGLGAEDIYVCYRGTNSQWKKVKLNGNDHLNNAPVHFKYTKEHKTKNITEKATLSRNGRIIKKCTFCDYECTTETILMPVDFKLTKSAYTYDGKAKEPKAVVRDLQWKKLQEGTDYILSYEKGCKLPGKYTVKIKFKGKYTGTVIRSFTIKPKATSSVSATQTTSAITLKWNKVTGADGYRVYKYDTKTKKYKKLKDVAKTTFKISNLKPGTSYKFKVRTYTKDGETIWGKYSYALETATKTKAPVLSKLTAGSKQLTANWKTVSGATGYQVVCSTSSKFTSDSIKKVTIKGAKATKATVKKLKKSKKYYVKVRAYKTVGGKTIYGAYSSVKNVKVK